MISVLWRMGVAALLCAAAYSQTVPLSYRPTAAEYSTTLDRLIMASASPNQLHIYNAAAGSEVAINLPSAPLSLSLSLDGLHAAVGHSNSISYVNLTNGVIERSYTLPGSILASVVLAAEYAYVFPPVGATGARVQLSSGAVEPTGFHPTDRALLHPSGQSVYSIFGSNLERYDVSPVRLPTSSLPPPQGMFSTCSTIWLSPEGSRIYTECGSVFASSTDPKWEMRYKTTLPGVSRIADLHESAVSNQIALIPGNVSPDTEADREVRLLESVSNRGLGRFLLYDFIVGGKKFAAHGKWVFFNSAGTQLYVVAMADASSGLAQNFAVQTIRPSASAPCFAAFSAATASMASSGGLSTLAITAPRECVYNAQSSANWIQLISGNYGSGDGILLFGVRPNLQTVSRTGTISLGTQTFTVTQDAAPLPRPSFNRLSYSFQDAEYDKQLDRLISVGTNPDELHIYDAFTGADQTVPLARPPLSVSVGPDGLHAAVGHDGWVSYVNLQTAAVERLLAIPINVQDVVIAGNGFVYGSSKSAAGRVYSLELATGAWEETYVSGGTETIRLHPSGNFLYTAGLDRAGKVDIQAGIAKAWAPQWLDSYTCGNLWLSENSARFLTACTFSYPVSEDPIIRTPDGKLAGLDHIQWSANSTIQQSTAVIPSNFYTDPSPHLADTEVQIFFDADLAFSGRGALSRFSAGGSTYPAHGRVVFWNRAATDLIAISQADPAANLLNDFATETFSAAGLGTGCHYALNAASAGAASSGDSGQVSVTTTPECSWKAESSVPWIKITSGAGSAGNGSIRYSVEENPTVTPRSGTLMVAFRIFTITQGPSGPDVTMSPRSDVIYGAGGGGTIGVMPTNGRNTWTATSSAPAWVRITSTTKNADGSGVVTYTVDANPTQFDREATFAIGNQTFYLRQLGKQANYPPAAGTLSPYVGTGDQIFTATFKDGNGWPDIAHARILISTVFAPSGGCYVDYAPATNALRLMNDAGTAWLGPITPGSASNLSNSLCTLVGATSTVSGTGMTLTVNASLRFSSIFGGKRSIFLHVEDSNGVAPSPLPMGVWYPAPAAPALTQRYRLYDPQSRTHHYTTDAHEYAVLGTWGFQQEGADSAVYDRPATISGVSSVPFWRIYIPSGPSHFWTSDRNEYETLMKYPYTFYFGEGADTQIFPSSVPNSIALYRLVFLGYGPPIHHWTTDAYEHSVLSAPGGGWRSEGIAGYVFPPSHANAGLAMQDKADKTERREMSASAIPVVLDIGNPASYRTGRIVPGEICTILGHNLQGDAVSVLFDGLEAAVLRSPEGRLEVRVPAQITGKDHVDVEVIRDGMHSRPIRAQVVDSDPAIWTLSKLGRGQAIAFDESAVANSADSPAKAGATISLRVVGIGLKCSTPIVRIGSIPSEVVDIKTMPLGYPEITIRVPGATPSGPTVPVSLQCGESFSQSDATVAIR